MKKGFTLIEIIISLGIVAVLGLTISQIFISTVRTNTKTEILKEVKQNGEFAMETMVRMMQSAERITSACTGATTNSITILNPDGFSTTFGCVATGNLLRVASTSASTLYLTSASVTLGGSNCGSSTLAFTCTSALGLPSTVIISMDVAQAGATPDQFEQASASFQTSVNTRNVESY